MSETGEKRLFKLTESDVSAIRAAMVDFDGSFFALKVRTTEPDHIGVQQAETTDLYHSRRGLLRKNGIDGYEVELQLAPNVQKLGILAEQPKAQRQVITTAIEHRPALSDAQVPDVAVAVTERERIIAHTQHTKRQAAVTAVAPEALDAILTHLEQNR